MVRAAMTLSCPPGDVLGALVQQILADDESERVRSHLDECRVCAQAVVAAVRGGVMGTEAAPTVALGTPSLPQIALSEPIAIDAKIGRYDVRGLLGAGGMGHVYEAYDAQLDRTIALKVLRPELAIAETLAERLVRESRLMAKVSHPSVITVYDVGREGDTVFIAMELIRGETLGAYIARAKPPWRTVVELFERAGAGLTAAHRAGIVHRDFKPDNVLVELDAGEPVRVVVTDFGIARASSIAEDLDKGIIGRPSDPRITRTGVAIGTPAYMAPEQLDGQAVDQRADVFAFSVSIWEALFGERPFPGTSVDEIRASMRRSPRPARGRVPRSLVRVLERGLARDPQTRWQDMAELVRELVALRGRRRRAGIAGAIAGLVGAGIATSLFLARPASVDPCAREALAYDAFALHAAIGEAALREHITSRVETAATSWRETHAATCKAGRHAVQVARTTACLEARRLELSGFVSDVIQDRGAHARAYVALVGDPGLCGDPAPGLLTPKVPEDPALRRKVTELRYRAFAAEATRNRGDFKTALAEAAALVPDAEATWPFVHAEALYLLGATQALGGDTNLAVQTLRRAAAVAETAHHDYIAANSWIQLVFSSTGDQGAPGRGLEYVTYAEAALERLGRPPYTASMLEYARGTTLIELARFEEAEAALRRAVELATTHGLDTLPEAIQGLGYLYESQGRYADAVDAYRTALEKLPTTDGRSTTAGAVIFRQRLAINLAMLGEHAEAESLAREAVRIAEDTLAPEHIDRAITYGTFAEVLLQAGRLDEALEAIHTAQHVAARIEGERSARYGELTQVEAEILGELGRFAESARRFERACDILAFYTGEGSAAQAACWLGHAIMLGRSRDLRGALALVDKTLPILVDAYGDLHPQVANAHLTRGSIRLDLEARDAAVADLEQAVALFEKLSLDAGHLAAAQFALAKALWPRDRDRAGALLDSAIATFQTASESWAETREEATAWLTTKGRLKRH
jgi:eukaryotic-like serine/threonine-protein kinase